MLVLIQRAHRIRHLKSDDAVKPMATSLECSVPTNTGVGDDGFEDATRVAQLALMRVKRGKILFEDQPIWTPSASQQVAGARVFAKREMAPIRIIESASRL